MTCKQCGRLLQPDEIALHKRLIHRGAESFWCLDCMAAYFACDRQVLEDKIRYFRSIGCLLFEPEKIRTHNKSAPEL